MNADRFTLPSSSSSNLRKIPRAAALDNEAKLDRRRPSLPAGNESPREVVRATYTTYATRSLIAIFFWFPKSIWSAVSGFLIAVSIAAGLIGKLTPTSLRSQFFSTFGRALCYAMQGLCVIQSLFLLEPSMDCKTSAERNHVLWDAPLSLTQIPSNSLPRDLTSPLPNYLLSNFALADNGAKVIAALTSPTAGLRQSSFVDRLLIWARGYDKNHMNVNPPCVVLEDHSAADCWKFEGSHGHIVLSLSDNIHWRGFTLHFPDQRSLSEDMIRQAPKELSLWALVSKDEVDPGTSSLLSDWKPFLVVGQLLDPSTFNSSNIFQQVARVSLDALNGPQVFSTHLTTQTSVILVEVLDNWGNDFTCLHRISIHGERV
ncbi:hypothetical protein BT96DRAFT_1025316 [Gymnopus androsaceus JB14]|uniref:SUN domain-containing protein n=1 Tax=Gymnopus androsaceus JB14 TaxID=1447944 RepID=A0A6A4GSQ3_9AGAR|nr:hypothetical protein BT96DRAFT_1025316 [Gymnopus androsaceus JB14]